MTYFYVSDQQITGYTDDPNNGIPADTQLIESEFNSFDNVFYNPKTEKIELIPEKPYFDSVWNINEWIEPVELATVEPFDTFTSSALGEPVVYKKDINLHLLLLGAIALNLSTEIECKKQNIWSKELHSVLQLRMVLTDLINVLK